MKTEFQPSEAYAAVLLQATSLPPDQTVRVNLDPDAAVCTILGALSRMRRHRAALNRMPGLESNILDRAELLAAALAHANALCAQATRPLSATKAVLNEAYHLREMLHADVNWLVRRDLTATESLSKYSGLNGYKRTAGDLQLLASLLRHSDQNLTSNDELVRAENMSLQLMQIAGDREQTEHLTLAALDIRARIFTLLLREYDRARSAITFLRFDHGDADRIAPSLYAKRNTPSRRRAHSEAVPANTSPSEAAPILS